MLPIVFCLGDDISHIFHPLMAQYPLEVTQMHWVNHKSLCSIADQASDFLAFEREILVPRWLSQYRQGHTAKELGLDCWQKQGIFLFYRPFVPANGT